MALSFFEANRPYVMPNGGVLNTGEIAGLDPTVPANASAIAAGILVASGAPPAFVPLPTTRVKIVATQVMVNGVPPLYGNGEIVTFPAAVSAQLIAAGLAVAN